MPSEFSSRERSACGGVASSVGRLSRLCTIVVPVAVAMPAIGHDQAGGEQPTEERDEHEHHQRIQPFPDAHDF